MIGIGVNIRPFLNKVARAAADYYNRITADGGVSESPDCVNSGMSDLDRQNLLNNASLLLIPSGYKGGKLYSEIPTNGNGDLTWTRGGDAFRTNASGVLQRVPWNLVQYSEQFENVAWLKTNSSVSGNVTIAPNGTLTADKLVENSTNANHYTNQSVTNTNSLITYSIYAKASERNFLYVSAFATLPNNFGYVPSAYFDLTNGTLGTTSGCNASIVNVGNGWFRCIIQCTSVFASSSATVTFYNYTATANGINSYQGDGTSGIFIWGAQLVEGTTAQTYLPTTDRLNFPRLSYMYGSCPSVLLEPQRTNLMWNSGDFQNASWGKSAFTFNSTETAPDGTLSARNYTTTASFAYALQVNTVTSGSLYTSSVFLKYTSGVGSFAVRFSDNTSTNFISVTVNLTNGTIGSVSYGGNGANGSATITTLTNGWYRVSITGSILGTSAGLVVTNLGLGNTTFSIWGGQVEQGAYSTTYIPTTSANATRVADSFSRSNIYTNGLISASGGTWFVEFRGNTLITRDGFASMSLFQTSALTNSLIFFNGSNSSGDRIQIAKFVSGTPTTVYTTTTNTVKIAIKWNGTSADIFANGTKVVSATSFTTTQMDSLAASNGLQMFIQQMALFPTPLSDTDCELLTGTAYSSYESMATALGYYVI